MLDRLPHLVLAAASLAKVRHGRKFRIDRPTGEPSVVEVAHRFVGILLSAKLDLEILKKQARERLENTISQQELSSLRFASSLVIACACFKRGLLAKAGFKKCLKSDHASCSTNCCLLLLPIDINHHAFFVCS